MTPLTPGVPTATPRLAARRAAGALALALGAALAAGCAMLPRDDRSRPAPATTPPPAVARESVERLEAADRAVAAERRRREAAEQERDQLRRERALLLEAQRDRDLVGLAAAAAAQREAAACSGLEEQQAALALQLVERDVQVKALTERLDGAIREVVRAMARLRSLESRAEAASHLAEAEIAVRRVGAEGEPPPGLVEAEPLLAAAVHEFQRHNYGGVLYLATQVKSLLKAGPQPAVTERQPRTEGEVVFAVPLPLRALAQSEVRQGPGSEYPALFVAEEGAPLTSGSVKGLWVRVTTEDGRTGWIHYTLVTRR